MSETKKKQPHPAADAIGTASDPSVRQQLEERRERELYLEAQAAYSVLAKQLGIDPRPSALDYIGLFGPKAALKAPERPCKNVIAVGWRGRADKRPNRPGDVPRAWDALQGLSQSLAGLRVAAVLDWSDDGLDPDDEQKVWHRVAADEVFVLDAVQIVQRELLRKAGGPDKWLQKSMTTYRNGMERLEVRARRLVGEAAHTPYVKWLSAGPSTDAYHVRLHVEGATDGDGIAPNRAGMPLLMNGRDLLELASVLPDIAVVECTGRTREDIAEGFKLVRRRPGSQQTKVHALEETAAAAAKRLKRLHKIIDADPTDRTSQPGPVEQHEFLLHSELKREDLRWLWPAIDARRRVRAVARHRAVDGEDTSVPDDRLDSDAAAAHWDGVARSISAHMTASSLTKVKARTVAQYPIYLQCPSCSAGWLHGCASCRRLPGQHGCCRGARCGRCDKPLTLNETLVRLTTDDIHRRVMAHRDRERKRSY